MSPSNPSKAADHPSLDSILNAYNIIINEKEGWYKDTVADFTADLHDFMYQEFLKLVGEAEMDIIPAGSYIKIIDTAAGRNGLRAELREQAKAKWGNNAQDKANEEAQ